MSQSIILICNTCPFRGEVFLRNELQRIPEDREVILFPILLGEQDQTHDLDRPNVRVETAGAHPTGMDRFMGLVHSVGAVLRFGELKPILGKKQPLRNLAKALKFAYVAESRARAISRWLKQNRPGEDYLFYAYWLYETAYTAARLRKRYPGSRFIARCHGFDLYEIRHPNGYLPYRPFLMEQADRLYPISDDGKAYLGKLWNGRWDQKLRTMRLGTEDHGVSTAHAGEGVTLVSCSNLVDVKRVDRIIGALALCPQEIFWHHFGDGPLMDRLKKKAEALPANIRWQFHGLTPNPQIMEFYKTNHVDAFLNVSASEGVPVSVMEALSFGIPAIATDVGGTHEILEDGRNGILLDPEFSDAALAEAITRLTACPREEQERLRASARRIWEQKCSARRNYEAFYRELSQEL